MFFFNHLSKLIFELIVIFKCFFIFRASQESANLEESSQNNSVEWFDLNFEELNETRATGKNYFL